MNTSKFESWARDIQEHAVENYEHDGWDFIVETWTLDEIVDEISQFNSFDEAISRIANIALILAAARDEVIAEIF